jgi:hypothetical protein
MGVAFWGKNVYDRGSEMRVKIEYNCVTMYYVLQLCAPRLSSKDIRTGK